MPRARTFRLRRHRATTHGSKREKFRGASPTLPSTLGKYAAPSCETRLQLNPKLAIAINSPRQQPDRMARASTRRNDRLNAESLPNDSANFRQGMDLRPSRSAAQAQSCDSASPRTTIPLLPLPVNSETRDKVTVGKQPLALFLIILSRATTASRIEEPGSRRAVLSGEPCRPHRLRNSSVTCRPSSAL